MQVSPQVWGPVPMERSAQYEQALEVLSILEWQCGSRRRALNAYHLGTCNAVSPLVTWRCGVMGCDEPKCPAVPRGRECN